METTTETAMKERRRAGVHRRPRSFSLDSRVLDELDRRAEGENLSRLVEHLLLAAMGMAHPESQVANRG